MNFAKEDRTTQPEDNGRKQNHRQFFPINSLLAYNLATKQQKDTIHN